ncbi:hypothetical protein PtA15_16A336 [Puccinia triticina]|uniref:Uncharacterized protein n=1 Tax=Puccinia triticina TaxID=208348 RepID=A0ABY7D752_9BASI|nr:uncharacterized protein PtA15_16A336 [Puccinia triticina]WAQ92428.1 hypothetical protein PtA15_16A336 [Puccinia triticina]
MFMTNNIPDYDIEKLMNLWTTTGLAGKSGLTCKCPILGPNSTKTQPKPEKLRKNKKSKKHIANESDEDEPLIARKLFNVGTGTDGATESGGIQLGTLPEMNEVADLSGGHSCSNQQGNSSEDESSSNKDDSESDESRANHSSCTSSALSQDERAWSDMSSKLPSPLPSFRPDSPVKITDTLHNPPPKKPSQSKICPTNDWPPNLNPTKVGTVKIVSKDSEPPRKKFCPTKVVKPTSAKPQPLIGSQLKNRASLLQQPPALLKESSPQAPSTLDSNGSSTSKPRPGVMKLTLKLRPAPDQPEPSPDQPEVPTVPAAPKVLLKKRGRPKKSATAPANASRSVIPTSQTSTRRSSQTTTKSLV